MLRSRQLSAALLLVLTPLALAAGAEAAAPNTLAILNLRPTNFEAMGYNGEILYALISALEKIKTVELVPRRQMEDKLFQAGLVQGDTPEMALEAGKVLGIRFILFGNVTKEGARIRAHLSLMDAKSQRIVQSWTEDYVSREDILSRIPRFADDLSEAISRGERAGPVAAAAAAPRRPEVSLDAFRAVSAGDSVIVRWEAASGAPIAGYHVYRADSPDGPYQFLGRTDAPPFTDDGIRKGRSYYYRIGVLLGAGQEVKPENTAEIRNAGEKQPHPPLILGAKGFVQRIEIKFVPNLLNDQDRFKVTEYRVFRRAAPEKEWTAVAEAPATFSSQSELGFTFEDARNLEDGRTYTYAIASIERKGRESPLSDPVTVRTVPRPQLALEKEGLLRRVELSWTAVDNIEGYYLYRRQEPESWQRVEKIRGQPPGPFTDDNGLEDGQRYEYRITAYDAQGETGPSNSVPAKTKALPPPPADVIARSGLVKSVQLTWTPVEDPDVGGYAVYSAADPQQLKPLTKVKGHRESRYRDQGSGFSPLKDGTDYFYALASYNLFGAEGPVSPTVRARTKPRPLPAGGIRLSALTDRIRVQWRPNAEPDVRAYTLYRNRNGGGWYKIGETGPGETAYSDADLKPESEYRYRIVVEDADGLKSDPAESGPIASPITNPES